MALTGGTAAPKMPAAPSRASPKLPVARTPVVKAQRAQPVSGRIAAAAHALGAPKATVHPAKALAARAPGKAASPGRGGEGERSWLQMTPGELQQLASKEVQQNTQAELQPFRARQGEITGTEQTVAKRFGGYGEASDKLLGGIQASAEGSAKTLDNEAAESAMKARQGVESAGQTAQSLTAGYLDPQVRAQLGAEQANVAGIGAGQQASAQALGQGETNFITGLRAAAAQRVAEGQRGITSQFGAQRAKVAGEEGKLLARMPGQTTKLDTELLQKQFTNRATEAGLGIKQGTLAVSQQKANAEGRYKAGELTSKERSLAGQERGRSITQEHYQADAAYKAASIAQKEVIDNKDVEEKSAKIKDLLAKASPTGAKPLTTSQANKLSTELGAAYNAFSRLRTEGLPPTSIRNALTVGQAEARGASGKVEKYKVPRVESQVLIKAAEELWNTHRVSKPTRALLGRLGMNIGTDAEAFAAVSG